MEFEHDGFVLHQKTTKILDELDIDMEVLCTILEEEDIDARKYALEVLKPTKTLYNYLKGKIEYTRTVTYSYFGNKVTTLNYSYPKYIKAVYALREYGKYKKMYKKDESVHI